MVMQIELRMEGFYDEDKHIIEYLNSYISIKKESWYYVSLSFYYNIFDEPP